MPDPAIMEPCMTRCANFIDIDSRVNPDDGKTTFTPYCRAYPNGIPLDVLQWKRKHEKPLDDQKGAFVFVDFKDVTEPI